MKKKFFDDLVESIEEAGRIRQGSAQASRVFVHEPIDVKGIREKLHVSQTRFAMMIGVSRSTLQNWEQGRRRPAGSARALLKLVEKNPSAVIDALGG